MRDNETFMPLETISRTRTGLNRAPRCLFVGIAVYLAIAAFETNYGVVQPGLDASWMYALNAAADAGQVFGRDVVFTYGPLGFLMRPRAVGANLGWAAAFVGMCQLLLALALIQLLRQSRSKAGALLALLGLVIAYVLGLWEEYSYRLILGLWLLLGLSDHSGAIVACAVAGCFAALLCMIKFSLFATAVVMLAVWIGLAVWQRPAQTSRRIAVLVVTYSVSMAICVWWFFHTPSNFLRWAVLSKEISVGYGAAQSVPGPMIEALGGVLLVLAFGVAALIWKGPGRLPFILFSLPVLMALKHGFVGFTTMATGYFTFVLAVSSLPFLYAATRRELAIAAVLFLSAASFAIAKGAWGISSPPLRTERVKAFLTGQMGLQNIAQSWNWRQVTRTLQREAEQVLAEQHLPQHWIEAIAHSPRGVNVLPSELSYIAANHLDWQPNLVLQLYAAYTSRLDNEVAKQLRSERAPGALLLEFTDIVGRHVVLDTPATFRALLNTYEPVETDYRRNLMLLRRRAQPSAEQRRYLTTSLASDGQWINIPRAAGKLYARILLRPNLEGYARRLLWKTSSVELSVEYASGRRQQWRLLADTAANGVLVDPIPASLEDLDDLFQGVAYDKVKRLSVSGPGMSSYRTPFTIEWIEDPEPLRRYGNPDAASPPRIMAVGKNAKYRRQTETVQIVASNAQGARRLRFVEMIINDRLDGNRSCYLNYDVATGALSLLGDSGKALAGQGAVGALDVLENSKCAINLAETDLRFRGQLLELNLAVALRGNFPRQESIFASAVDSGGNRAPWSKVADWQVESNLSSESWKLPAGPPSVFIGIARAVQPGGFVLTARISDPNGRTDIQWAQILINHIADGYGACYLHFDRQTGTISLVGGNGDAGPLKLGSPGRMSSSACEISTDGSTIIEGPRDVTLRFYLHLGPEMQDRRVIFTTALDREGLRQNWKISGQLPN